MCDMKVKGGIRGVEGLSGAGRWGGGRKRQREPTKTVDENAKRKLVIVYAS